MCISLLVVEGQVRLVWAACGSCHLATKDEKAPGPPRRPRLSVVWECQFYLPFGHSKIYKI